jgi:hypothetical protein
MRGTRTRTSHPRAPKGETRYRVFSFLNSQTGPVQPLDIQKALHLTHHQVSAVLRRGVEGNIVKWLGKGQGYILRENWPAYENEQRKRQQPAVPPPEVEPLSADEVFERYDVTEIPEPGMGTTQALVSLMEATRDAGKQFLEPVPDTVMDTDLLDAKEYIDELLNALEVPPGSYQFRTGFAIAKVKFSK